MSEAKSICSEENLISEFQAQNWKDLWKTLFARSLYLLNNKYQVGWNNDKKKDFINQCISDVIDKIMVEKSRNWNTAEYPTFKDFIESVIDSHINNQLNKKREPVISENELTVEAGIAPTNLDDDIAIQELHGIIFEELKKIGATDEEVLVFDCLAGGMFRKQDIRENLGIDDDEFNNIWRRLNRKREVIKKIMIAHGYKEN